MPANVLEAMQCLPASVNANINSPPAMGAMS
jgi:hypothetical protein